MTVPGQHDPDAEPDQQHPPVCFRHPGRETWVSCVRCGRYACPDCLRQAAVGQQCVECVRGATAAGGRPVRQARTVFGGRPGSSATVTWVIVGLNVLLYLVQLARPGLVYQWGMLGVTAITPAGLQAGVAGGQWYRLLTSAFITPGTGTLGVMDIAFNLWALVLVGPQLERMFGSVRYLAIYLLSAAGGGLCFYYMAPDGVAAGASGAIFGLFAAWFVVAKRLRTDSRAIVVLIVINLAFSFIFHSTIAWQDHIGGLIAGGLVTAAYAYAPRKSRTALQVAATVAVAAMMVIATVIQNGRLTS
jgi:membrane associated rhomboid family serine protease